MKTMPIKLDVPEIHIEVIPHNEQRYRTIGDYYERDGKLEFRISDMGNPDYNFLCLIHELIEWYTSRRKGVTIEQIDAFDIQYEKERDLGMHTKEEEPGHDPKCPVYEDHVFAECMERMLGFNLGIRWQEYEKVAEGLDEEV